jgi:hypothetical protein
MLEVWSNRTAEPKSKIGAVEAVKGTEYGAKRSMGIRAVD